MKELIFNNFFLRPYIFVLVVKNHRHLWQEQSYLVNQDEDIDRPLCQFLLHEVEVDEDLHEVGPQDGQGDDAEH